jgi:3-deoxy-D-manno-octulosonate 8-phosphate phosphatase (KDO 8-P phosphatase)
MDLNPALTNLAGNVRGIVFDVDGVLTDGRIIYSDDGHELKAFNVQDGASIKLLQQHQIEVAIVTGRRSPMVARRARELGITFLVQGAQSKAAALDKLIEQGFPDAHNAAVGDDIQDIAVFTHPSIALSISVPNAHPATLAKAHWVTTRSGGDGVVVEIAEVLLKAQGTWPF